MSAIQNFDVCVVCALPEEANAFIEVVESLCNVKFKEGFSINSGPYRYTTIFNNMHEPVTLHLSWLSGTGMVNLALDFNLTLREFKPRFAGMSGICAGDKRKVKVGDVIVAESAFIGDGDKITLDDDGQRVIEYNTTTWQTSRNIHKFVQMFVAWKDEVAKLTRPISKHQQRDWILSQLLDVQTPRVDDISRIKRQEMEIQAKDWRKIVQEIQAGNPPFLTPQRSLYDRQRVEELDFLYDFPYQDPDKATCHVAPMASVSAVRSDRPFDQIRVPVRKTVAIDMEGAAFYQAAEGISDTLSLLVKGVCDYADPDKDDLYHKYASEASAIYMQSFIKEFISSKYGVRLWPKDKPSPARAGSPSAGQQSPEESDESQLASLTNKRPSKVDIFFSYAPEDDQGRINLEMHLITLKRNKNLVYGYSESMNAGAEKLQERDWMLQHARLILLLISRDYVFSERCYAELQQIAELYKKKNAYVIPILLRITDSWKDIPFGDIKLGGLQQLPLNGKSVQEVKPADEAYRQVAEGIRHILEKS